MAKKGVTVHKISKLHIVVAMRKRGSGLYNNYKTPKYKNRCKFSSPNATTKYHLNIFEKKKKKKKKKEKLGL
jgi:hypothetical protein